jgi:ATP-dependent DNA helicase RecG
MDIASFEKIRTLGENICIEFKQGRNGFEYDASQDFIITPNNLEPNPKNPIISNFFRNIGYADKLGSGVRNLFKYSKFYSGKDPIFEEKDVFKITVPLDDEFFYKTESKNSKNNLIEITQAPQKTTQANEHYNNINKKATFLETTQAPQKTTQTSNLSEEDIAILSIIKQFPQSSLKDIAKALKWKKEKVGYYVKKLKAKGFIERVGSSQKGYWKTNFYE